MASLHTHDLHTQTHRQTQDMQPSTDDGLADWVRWAVLTDLWAGWTACGRGPSNGPLCLSLLPRHTHTQTHSVSSPQHTHTHTRRCIWHPQTHTRLYRHTQAKRTHTGTQARHTRVTPSDRRTHTHSIWPLVGRPAHSTPAPLQTNKRNESDRQAAAEKEK